MPESVSIIIPAYNEARFIASVVRKVCASPIPKDVIVVDDGSTDGSPAILAELARELPIQVVTHPKNQGKGRAIHTGLAKSTGPIVLIQDADEEYDPEDYPALLKPIWEGRTSVVYGSRFLGAHRATYFWHRLGNWLITTFLDLLFNASLTDVESGYKVFRREVVAPLRLRAAKYDIEVELTCKLLKQGHTIFEVPIAYYGRSYAEGKKITWRDGVAALAVILWCRLNPRY